MSDGSLSQDEIDALLQGSGGMDFDEEPGGADLDDGQVRAFNDLVGKTLDSQGSNFSMLVNTSVSMDQPKVRALRGDQLVGELDGQMVQISLNYSSGVPGEHLYLLGIDAAVAIAGPMMGQSDIELDDAAVNALQEAVSQIHGPVSTAIGERASQTVMTAAPEGKQVDKDNLDLPAGSFLAVDYPLTIDGRQFTLHEVFSADIVQSVVPAQSAAPGQAAAGQSQQAAVPQGAAPAGGQQDQGLAAMMGGQQAGGQDPMAGMFGGPAAGTQMGGNPGVQSVQFPNLQGGGASGEQGNISLLMDVYMEMTVELGRTRKLIKEILGMGEGTIIELDKLAGEPVDILVNHKLIAKGEVVVIDENFGVRVTEIVSPMERVSNMS